MATSIPQATPYFRCVHVQSLPELKAPPGQEAVVKTLYPVGFFNKWSRDPDPQQKVYVGHEIRTKVIGTLEPVSIAQTKGLSVYCWEPITTVSWDLVYKNFPTHGLFSKDYQVIPWVYLRHLAMGWTGLQQVIVPKDDRGAVFWLGDAGVKKTSLYGPMTVGTKRWLASIGFFQTIAAPTWNLFLPEQEGNNRDELPSGTILITIR